MSAPNKSFDPVEVAALSQESVDAAVADALAAVAAASDLDALKEARLAHAGDRSPLALANREIGALPPQAKAEAGKRVGEAGQAHAGPAHPHQRRDVQRGRECRHGVQRGRAALVVRQEVLDASHVLAVPAGAHQRCSR